MPVELLMPRLSETSPIGTVVEWLAHPGDRVRKGQILVRVESDKAALELEAPEDGALLHVFFSAGDEVPAAAVLGLLGNPGEAVTSIDPLRHLEQAVAAAPPDLAPSLSGPPRRRAAGSATSAEARRRSRGMDATPASAPLESGRIEPLSRIRRLTGERLLESARRAPHAFVEVEADAAELASWRAAAPEPAPSYTALFVQAASLALREFPHLNASFRPEGILVWPEINVGIAVSRRDELVVPVLRRADGKSLAEITEFLRAYGPEALGGVRPADASGGTFTISNLGMAGADRVLSILSPGQAGILSFGRIRPRPSVVRGEIAIRSLLNMTLGFDHRVLDGAMAARFLARLEEMLVRPDGWAC
jgi:pyruvate dehydrogenase E2 component (dihydrolipoamide acetyltransferase)